MKLVERWAQVASLAATCAQRTTSFIDALAVKKRAETIKPRLSPGDNHHTRFAAIAKRL